jgi:uridylate kinase
LRAAEVHADLIMKATKVDGVYDADPHKEATAQRFEQLTYEDAIQRNLQFMDQTAIQLCRQNGVPIVVFDMTVRGNILKVVSGETVGTLVSD